VGAARRLLVPLAPLLVAVAPLGAATRLSVFVALPVLVLGVGVHRLPRSVAAAVALLLGVLALAGGPIARTELLVVSGLLYLVYLARMTNVIVTLEQSANVG
jgi:hypothetical protein